MCLRLRLDPFWAHDQPPDRVVTLMGFELAQQMLAEDAKEKKAFEDQLHMIRALGGEVFDSNRS